MKARDRIVQKRNQGKTWSLLQCGYASYARARAVAWCRLLLQKAHVKQYEKRSATGELVEVKEHEDKRPAAKVPEPGDTYDRDPYAKQLVESRRAAEARGKVMVQAARQPVPVVHGTTPDVQGAGAKAPEKRKQGKPQKQTPEAPRFRDMLEKPKEGIATKVDDLVTLARERNMNEAMFRYHDWPVQDKMAFTEWLGESGHDAAEQTTGPGKMKTLLVAMVQREEENEQ